MDDFPTDYACAEYLERKLWPDGFACPHCGGRRGWRLEARPWVFECAGDGEAQDGQRCRRQTSLIAGTVMHGTHLPLRKWFIAAFLVATHSNGISTLQLQAKLGLGSYKTAWLLPHKLRRAMVRPDRKPLSGTIEVDETFIPHRKRSDPISFGSGRRSDGLLTVIGAVERLPGGKFGRVRLKRIDRETVRS